MIKAGRAQVIDSKGCSKLFLSSSLMPSFRKFPSFEPASMSPAAAAATTTTTTSSILSQPAASASSFRSSNSPFSGLVICVTGLSKEARKQVMEATERLGGQYSPNLHPQCTHLVVQSFGGRKFEHALKHGSKNGLFIVTLGCFVDSVRRNVRLRESLYSVKSLGENGVRVDELNRLVGLTASESSCLPVGINDAKQFDKTEAPQKWPFGKTSSRSADPTLSGCTFYIDSDISNELQNKIYEAASREGATILDQWFTGCNVSHIVCEGPSAQKYIGHCNNIVTPLWVLKTTKEKHLHRLVHMSADLARQVGVMLENFQNEISGEEMHGGDGPQYSENLRGNLNQEERQKIVNFAKTGVRNRRGRRMQTCQMPVRPITPSSLLDSICWSISEPTSAACIYTDSLSSDAASEHHTPVFFDAKGDIKDSEAPFVNLTRPLSESEKAELIFKDPFLTILFPIDRFSEMGPSARTFFSEKGFTCLQVLDHVYAFCQEKMPAAEIEVAIHTDSRHADRLRSVYSSNETEKLGCVSFRRIDFLGSRKSFDMLKRVSGDNNSNVYELLIRA